MACATVMIDGAPAHATANSDVNTSCGRLPIRAETSSVSVPGSATSIPRGFLSNARPNSKA